jgi:hypothetical protein
VSATMAIAAILPESSQLPLGVLYAALGLAGGVLLFVALPQNEKTP